ncbi:hypothetical protein LWI29_034621 [Acer saccharum]|uniref:RRM domain-containing protein n=1 Tax=Acer saccharum TaxID=4024 RepID=A0AA39W3H7_ACESA|nr:hypothetical protein LWI29_034621 [Acer saccharum]KAK1584679.1 hypothetical protein Q3G72_035164 [Acer saccharum]
MASLRSVAAPRNLRRFFSTTNFPAFNTLPNAAASEAAQQHPKAEPSTNLHITGLSKRTTTEKLREKASEFGEVINARVVTDRVTGYSRCFGFVKYATLEDAAKGITGMDGQFLDGWVIFAEYARPRLPRPPPPSQNTSSPYGNTFPPYGRQ